MTSPVLADRLEAFVAAARRRVRNDYYALHGTPLAPNGLLTDALHPSSIIAELKPRSPSTGPLLQGSADRILAAYVEGDAAAISCLADPDHFDGSPGLVRQAHATGLPVLWKDFVVHPDQILAAGHHGASAILLIEAVFDDPDEREALVQAAHAQGLEVLLEVHDPIEAERARSSRADLLGVNARDLHTLREDPEGALEVLRSLADDRPLVALSSIRSRADVRRAMAAGATSTLVGTALMKDLDPALRLRSLQRPLAKVCGIRDDDSVQAALDAGADLIGIVVLSPDSPRDVPVQTAAHLFNRIHTGGARSVLVTDCDDPEQVLDAVRRCSPHLLQAHGTRFDRTHRDALQTTGTRVLLPIRPGNTPPSPDAVILDASKGKGIPLDLAATRRSLAHATDRLTLVAGGLGPDDVQDALDATGAWGADASSRLESTPGVKDPARVRAFVEACHAA